MLAAEIFQHNLDDLEQKAAIFTNLHSTPLARMFDPDRYTVGWICAIHEEYTASRAFLDEIHDDPDSVSLNDNNHYTLGKLGKHHVVMAVLPDGGYGTCSAAIVARDLLHNFPNIRIGLMVGIGGGAPSQDHDIRLGDIVVSSPGQETGGVVQFDFGKAIQDQNFVLTGFKNQPPLVLRTAVNGLKTKYESDGHQLEKAITSILEKKPRLQKKYRRPDLDTDRLCKSSVVHPPGNKATCAEVCTNDTSALVLQRTEREDNPMIHYGLIASSNQLMKDAFIRDKLAAEKDVLCFEMEAAGLMDHFPCLVIRGICDYSDSHKNKDWQGYAAMAAAAYAKDLLSQIPPNRVEAQIKISDIVLGESMLLGKLFIGPQVLIAVGVQETVNTMSTNVDSLLQDQERRRAIIELLAATDYSAQQRDHLEKRQERTCEWLLKSDEFQSWLARAGQTLFCPGIPGAGKTIAASIVVDHLCRKYQNNDTVGIAFVFYSYQQPQNTHADLYSSLLGQLIRHAGVDSIKQLYNYHIKRGTHPSSEEIFNALNHAISEYSRVFIIIDALDECGVSDNASLRIIAGLFKLQGGTAANLFVTSRHMSMVTEKFKNRGSTILEIRAKDEDIRSYVESNIPDMPPFDTPGLEQEIITAIVRATDGM